MVATLALYDEIKEEAFARLLFIAELFVLSNPPSILIIERLLEYLV
jgi:hypothetical protein